MTTKITYKLMVTPRATRAGPERAYPTRISVFPQNTPAPLRKPTGFKSLCNKLRVVGTINNVVTVRVDNFHVAIDSESRHVILLAAPFDNTGLLFHKLFPLFGHFGLDIRWNKRIRKIVPIEPMRPRRRDKLAVSVKIRPYGNYPFGMVCKPFAPLLLFFVTHFHPPPCFNPRDFLG